MRTGTTGSMRLGRSRTSPSPARGSRRTDLNRTDRTEEKVLSEAVRSPASAASRSARGQPLDMTAQLGGTTDATLAALKRQIAGLEMEQARMSKPVDRGTYIA